MLEGLVLVLVVGHPWCLSLILWQRRLQVRAVLCVLNVLCCVCCVCMRVVCECTFLTARVLWFRICATRPAAIAHIRCYTAPVSSAADLSEAVESLKIQLRCAGIRIVHRRDVDVSGLIGTGCNGEVRLVCLVWEKIAYRLCSRRSAVTYVRLFVLCRFYRCIGLSGRVHPWR